MSLPKPRMESPQCSKMKPMTVEQGAIYAKYRINHDAINEHNLKAWRTMYTHVQSVLDTLKENLRGARPDATT